MRALAAKSKYSQGTTTSVRCTLCPVVMGISMSGNSKSIAIRLRLQRGVMQHRIGLRCRSHGARANAAKKFRNPPSATMQSSKNLSAPHNFDRTPRSNAGLGNRIAITTCPAFFYRSAITSPPQSLA